MLRVNPERRSTIEDIATHWWLNLDEDSQAIHELPENQVQSTNPSICLSLYLSIPQIDETLPPLHERLETLVVQDLECESDVFMEFSHLSAATRKRIAVCSFIDKNHPTRAIKNVSLARKVDK